jgi:hypothetical protein
MQEFKKNSELSYGKKSKIKYEGLKNDFLDK